MRVASTVAVLLALTLFGCGGGGGGSSAPAAVPPVPPPPLSTGPEACTGGSAGDFSCSGISLRKRVSLETMGGLAGNDIWGWFDAQTGNEYALMGLSTAQPSLMSLIRRILSFLGCYPRKLRYLCGAI